MADYSDFTVEAFVMDEVFQTHVKHPTAESIHFWEDWLEQHPQKAEAVRQARLIILSMDFKKTPEKEIPKELIFQRIRASIYAENSRGHSAKGFSWRSYQRIAAVFLGLIIATASFYLLTYESSETYTTAYGEVKHLTLPDGSKVVLNANSSVAFEKTWTKGDSREVTLEGEAFFDIVHTENHERFFVRTDQLDVEVLGTRFNVQTRRMRTRVVLNSGKVKINRKGSAKDILYMEPGELVEVSGARMQKRIVDPEDFSSWKKGQLIFKATPLGEIAQTLEDHYGWKAAFEDESMKAYQFTGAVSTESLEEVRVLLYTISESFNMEVVQEGDQLIFKKNY